MRENARAFAFSFHPCTRATRGAAGQPSADYGRSPPAITTDAFITRLCAMGAILVAVPAWVLTFLCVLHTLLLAQSDRWYFGVFRAVACTTVAILCTTIAIAATPGRRADDTQNQNWR